MFTEILLQEDWSMQSQKKVCIKRYNSRNRCIKSRVVSDFWCNNLLHFHTSSYLLHELQFLILYSRMWWQSFAIIRRIVWKLYCYREAPNTSPTGGTGCSLSLATGDISLLIPHLKSTILYFVGSENNLGIYSHHNLFVMIIIKLPHSAECLQSCFLIRTW